VDSKGNTIEFMLSEHRDAKSAERFFEKALGSPHSADPRVINVDKNAAYPPAMAALKKNDLVEDACKLRQVKYLNNIVEQDHRFIKRRVAPGLGFASFPTADRTLRGYEAMNMIRKGQIKGVEKEDITGQVKFIENLFGIAA
jgi:transposase-like protein